MSTLSDDQLVDQLGDIRNSALAVQLEVDELDVSLFARSIRAQLRALSSRVSSLASELGGLDGEIQRRVDIPVQINGAVLKSAQLSILFSVRRTTEQSIRDVKSGLSQIRAELNFYLSLKIAIIALVVSFISLTI